MKNILFILVFGAFCLQANAQIQAIDILYEQYKSEDCFSLQLSGNFLSGMFKEENKNNDELKQLATKIDKFKIINIPREVNNFSSSAILDLKKAVRRDNYEELITVNDADGVFNIFIKEEKGNVKEVVMIANNEDGLLLLTLSGNIPKNKVQELTEGIHIN